MQSRLQTDKECYITGGTQGLERHHLYGAANRKHSEQYGLWVYLQHDLHNEPPMGVHHNRITDTLLKKIGQLVFERDHTHEEFMRIFGRNYL